MIILSLLLYTQLWSFPVDHEPNMHSIIEKMGLSHHTLHFCVFIRFRPILYHIVRTLKSTQGRLAGFQLSEVTHRSG